MDKKVCGEFPEFCYKAFKCKKHAESFMDRGTFRMGCQLSYKVMEDKSLCDPTEGCGSIRVPGIVTHYGFTQDSAEKPIRIQKMGHIEKTGGSVNPRFCFCTCLPEVDHNHIKTLKKYIVKINNPRKLAEDINDYFANNEQGKYSIVGFNVIYNKGQESGKQLTTNEIVDLDYKQKPERFRDDCEFRIVAIKLGKVCDGECKFFDGPSERDDERNDPECEYIKIELGKKLDYLSFVT